MLGEVTVPFGGTLPWSIVVVLARRCREKRDELTRLAADFLIRWRNLQLGDKCHQLVQVHHNVAVAAAERVKDDG